MAIAKETNNGWMEKNSNKARQSKLIRAKKMLAINEQSDNQYFIASSCSTGATGLKYQSKAKTDGKKNNPKDAVGITTFFCNNYVVNH